MKIQNIGSNKTEVTKNNGDTFLVSYSTVVAALLTDGTGWVRTDRKYSVTTTKHINQWLKHHNAGRVTTIAQADLEARLEGGAL